MRTKKLSILFTLFGMFSCIEPQLHLPAQEMFTELPVIVTEMQVEAVWNVNLDWKVEWYYYNKWDNNDHDLWGDIDHIYPIPTWYSVRRYYLGHSAGAPHTKEGMDGFRINEPKFRRVYQFGYYDLLLWSEIDAEDNAQVVIVDDSDLDNVQATTSITRSASLISKGDDDPGKPQALYNQPEIFYSAYPRDIYISQNVDDYDYFDEKEHLWVKHIDCELRPLVYVYLVQILLYNNEGDRVKSISGDCAITGLANGVSVNTGHTSNTPCNVYFRSNMKRNFNVMGRNADIIGGVLTTYGLCDMEGYVPKTKAQYAGSRSELPNYLVFELQMSGGSIQALRYNVSDQLQAQCHGGLITIEIDCMDIDNPIVESGAGSIFQPTVEDYDELSYDIPM